MANACPLDSHQLELLLHDLCVDLGYCLPPEGMNFIRVNPPIDVDECTDIVMTEDGLSPEQYPEKRKEVRAVVARHFAAARIKRGLCPACAYPVGSSSVCTECGAAARLT
jgi:hypothetical protein